MKFSDIEFGSIHTKSSYSPIKLHHHHHQCMRTSVESLDLANNIYATKPAGWYISAYIVLTISLMNEQLKCKSVCKQYHVLAVVHIRAGHVNNATCMRHT